jgi:UDP-GlcNAc:undecaprenyl-phosphate GlcNAc-1-phosphate transferase
MKTYLLLGLAAFLISLAATPLVRLIAIRKGWVARPREDRWHKRTTALFGGIAIFIGIAIPLGILGDYQSIWQKIVAPGGSGQLPSIAVVILSGATLLFFLGLADDFLNLKPQNKLIGQIHRGQRGGLLGIPAGLVHLPDPGHHGHPRLDRRHHQRL